MCTLIIGLDVPGPQSVVIAANRDEDPARPSDPPGVLRTSPRVAGGRDRVAGGTWLAVREDGLVVAVLNRRPNGGTREPAARGEHALLGRERRSRGLLAIDLVATLSQASDALALTREALAAASYEACSLAVLTHRGGSIVSHVPGAPPRAVAITPGWHVITHADLDDRSEPRTAWLLGELARSSARAPDSTEAELERLLATHADPTRDRPAVCLHEGRMVTVSSSLLHLTAQGTRYRHVEGRPCEQPPLDYSALVHGAGETRGIH